jgi:hypothetical protein
MARQKLINSISDGSERQRMEQLQGSKIISSEQKKAILEKEAQNKIYNQAIESGMSTEQATQKVIDSGIGSITPNLDRAKAEERKLNVQRQTNPTEDLGGFKTYGDKASFEAKNAVRQLQGLASLPNPNTQALPPKNQFQIDLEKSASFGAESALVGPNAAKGQARAFEAGIRAGYTPEETRKLISDTASRITGLVDEQNKQKKFVSDFLAASPQSKTSVGPTTQGERISNILDQSLVKGSQSSRQPFPLFAPKPPLVGPDTASETVSEDIDKAFQAGLKKKQEEEKPAETTKPDSYGGMYSGILKPFETPIRKEVRDVRYMAPKMPLP